MHDQLLARIRSDGYAHVQAIGEARDFEAFVRELGSEVGRELVALRPGAHAYVARPGAVPLHTDHPDVDVIGWYCRAQDAEDGANWIFDSRPVIEALDDEVRAALTRVRLPCPPLRGGPPSERRPVLREDARTWRLFFPPWLADVDESQRALVKNVQERLSVGIRARKVAIRLAPGDALFVDNGRVLHGRGAIADASKRQLLRIWLQTKTASEVEERAHV